MNGLILIMMTRTRQQVGRQLTQEREAAPSPPTCEQSPVTRYFKQKKIEKKSRLYRIEHKTCDILAAERLRLMRFDNRLIIDSFQEAICILKW